jgi:bifunctional non-homologous end joining protein LigD
VKEAAHWAKPELVARVNFLEWTGDERLRAPVFLGFRDDVKPESCTFAEAEAEAAKAGENAGGSNKRARAGDHGGAGAEMASDARPAAARAHARAKRGARDFPSRGAETALLEELEKGGGETISAELDGKKLKLTNLNKVFFPEAGYRKRDLLAYYLRVAPYILPFLKDRPLVLKRYPNGYTGKFFFQKEAPASRPEWLKTASIYSEERKGKMKYLLADDVASLIWLVNMGCIDHNPWSSRFDEERQPDYVFFDLDPTEGTPFDVVCEVAAATQKHLVKLGAHSYLKTSGATGFHIYLPLERRYSYEQVRMFATAVGQMVKADVPKKVTFTRQVSARPKGTVLMDAAQNAYGKPLASVYSARPFPGAPVSTPVEAKELNELRPTAWNIETVPGRIEKLGNFWGDFWEHRQRLEDVTG